jgi:3-dehydroquinate dehydratase
MSDYAMAIRDSIVTVESEVLQLKLSKIAAPEAF